MPRYRAKVLSFVDGVRIRPGQEFTTNLPHNVEAWDLLDAPADKPGAKAAKSPAKEEDGKQDPFADWDDDKLRRFYQTKTQKAADPKWTRDELLAEAARITKGKA